MKRILIASLVLLAGCAAAPEEEKQEQPPVEEKREQTQPETQEEPAEEAQPSVEPQAAAPVIEESQDGGPVKISGIPIVNKKYGLDPGYFPGEDPTAKEAFTQMVSDMQAQGLDVSWDYSGFRSYDTQAGLYNSYVASSGQEAADTFSARPGFSEHQTGLAFDLKHTSGALLENPTEAQWLEDNCWKYGFIIRYKEGKEAITGYMAEPWHVRYIGDQAQAITESGLTLEEYLGAEGGDYN